MPKKTTTILIYMRGELDIFETICYRCFDNYWKLGNSSVENSSKTIWGGCNTMHFFSKIGYDLCLTKKICAQVTYQHWASLNANITSWNFQLTTPSSNFATVFDFSESENFDGDFSSNNVFFQCMGFENSLSLPTYFFGNLCRRPWWNPMIFC